MIEILIGAMAGAGIGYLWYRWVGCKGGSCYILRHRLLSILYWALFGALLANLFK